MAAKKVKCKRSSKAMVPSRAPRPTITKAVARAAATAASLPPALQIMANLELHDACSVGDAELLKHHLRSGKYDPNFKDPDWNNRTPLHWACSKGYVECVRLLLEFGAQGTVRMSMGWTPAHSSAEAGKLSALRALVTAGVAVDRKDKYGDTPRRVAEIYGHKECAAFLAQVERDKQHDIKSGVRSVSPVSDVSEDSNEDSYEKDPWFYRKH